MKSFPGSLVGVAFNLNGHLHMLDLYPVNGFLIRNSAGFAVEKNANYGKKVNNFGTQVCFQNMGSSVSLHKDHLRLMTFRLDRIRGETFRLLYTLRDRKECGW